MRSDVFGFLQVNIGSERFMGNNFCLNDGLFCYADIVVGSRLQLQDSYVDEVCFVRGGVVVVFNTNFQESYKSYNLNKVDETASFCNDYGLTGKYLNYYKNW